MKKLLLFVLILVVSIFAFVNFFKIPTKETSTPTNQEAKSALQLTSQESTIVAQNLKIPWAIAFLPNSNMLFTQRSGEVKEINKSGEIKTIFTVPDVKPEGEGGLHGVAVHPSFKQNNYIYLYYTYNPSPTLNKVVRYKYQNGSLTENRVILEKIPGSIFHNGGRIKFGPDSFLYITTGDAQEPSLAQDKNSLGGKILRVTDDGKPAADNPFNNEVYSYGHRNPQGIFWDQNNVLWEAEHGPSANDEINKIEIGKNYGWPEITGNQKKAGMESPYLTSGAGATWAPGDLIVISNKVYFAGLRGAAIFSFDPKEPTKVDSLFKNNYGRLRELTIGPDGNIYFTTSNEDGRGIPKTGDDKIIKITPKLL